MFGVILGIVLIYLAVSGTVGLAAGWIGDWGEGVWFYFRYSLLAWGAVGLAVLVLAAGVGLIQWGLA